MTLDPETRCNACGSTGLEVSLIAGQRRGTCPFCGHGKRIEIDGTDYGSVTMGWSGLDPDRLIAQADFVRPYLPGGAAILEIGCASGGLARLLRAGGPIGRYDGIEFSPARTAAAEVMDRVFDKGLPHLLVEAILAPATYDVVISSHCLEHVADIDREIRSVRRTLRPNGILFVEAPHRSGHPDLPFDDNRAHLQFFSVAFLASLLEAHGFALIELRTGAHFDARYPDAIRAIARCRPGSDAVQHLDRHPLLKGAATVVVWGAGKMVDEILEHFFDPARIAFFVDGDPTKQGSLRLGRPAHPVDHLRTVTDPLILINSMEYEAEIRREIESRFGTRFSRVIGIAALLDGATVA